MTKFLCPQVLYIISRSFSHLNLTQGGEILSLTFQLANDKKNKQTKKLELGRVVEELNKTESSISKEFTQAREFRVI